MSDHNSNSKLDGVLLCPKTKKPLTYDAKLDVFLDKEHNRVYDIKEGIPALLEEEGKEANTKASKEEEDEEL